MARSSATSVAAYLKELPAAKRSAIAAVRKTIRANLPVGYEEAVGWGMICYNIPLARFPKTYNGQPLSYVALGAQKNYNVLYLMRVYGDKTQEQILRDAFKAEDKKLDMGKACIRFKSPDDLALDAIGTLIANTTPDQFVALYEASRRK
jgi:hypothetical protein